ncbi:DUF192 domain-containing protein [Roseovarius sp. S4756]|uniref:DUF192 domain-containing protein n=1 Tax=Roseovarius maritimus TaxID=3342637 RepID=UPI00372B512C
MKQLAVACWLALVGTAALAEECRPDVVQLRGDWGQARFAIELADDEAERAQGLMHRESLPQSGGMLFVYPETRTVGFWMKNTLIPLDMIFVDATGTVARVHSNAVPGDLTPIMGGADIKAVLEINGGLAERLGIAPGTQMRHPSFVEDRAAWKC